MNRKFKKCLITGAGGSGGSYLAEHIINKQLDIQVHGFYRSKGYSTILKKYKKNLKLHKVDMQNYKRLCHLLRNIKPDVIFHLASDADVKDSFINPLTFAKNNVSITANLLEAVRSIKYDPIIIICSTSEVYGIVKKNLMPITENQKIEPINPYGVSKAYQDLISQVYSKTFNLKIIITRMFSYTNARRRNLFQTAFAMQIAECEKYKKKTLYHGNLKSVRTFVDIDDAMEAYWLSAVRGKIGEIYNICGKEVISVKKFLDVLLKYSKVKITPKLKKTLLRPVDIPLQRADCSKFIRHTGWKPKVKFEKSVKKLLDFCRSRV